MRHSYQSIVGLLGLGGKVRPFLADVGALKPYPGFKVTVAPSKPLLTAVHVVLILYRLGG
jgi:hypothetical protein